ARTTGCCRSSSHTTPGRSRKSRRLRGCRRIEAPHTTHQKAANKRFASPSRRPGVGTVSLAFREVPSNREFSRAHYPAIQPLVPVYTPNSLLEDFSMDHRGNFIKQATSLVVALSCVALSSIGGADSTVAKRQGNIADQELFFAPVPKAVCGPGDNPETALQGQ